MLIEAVRASGIDPERLTDGLSVQLSDLTDPRKRINWETFTALHDNLERALGHGTSLEDIGARIVDQPSYHFLRGLAGFAISAETLHRAGWTWGAPVMFPHIRVDLERPRPGHLVVQMEIPPGHRESPAFIRVTAGCLRMVSALIDGRPSTIETTIDGRRATIRIALPPPMSFVERTGRLVRGLRGVPGVVGTLAEEQHAVNASYQSLLRTRHGFLDALERSPACAAIHRDGKFAWMNAALARALGYSAEELRGKDVACTGWPSAQTASATEYPLLRKDGTVATFELAPAQEIEFYGQAARLVLGIDVSEKKKMQEQLLHSDRMAALGMLAAGVAHEINNPLTYVLMSLDYADALSDDPERSKAALRTAREGLGRIRTITSDLQMFSRESGDARSAVDVASVLDATLSLVIPGLRHRATVVRDFLPVPLVSANRDRLGQVFLNILLNAGAALAETDGPHRIEVRTCLDDEGFVVVEIADTGVGIAPEHLDRVFDPFFSTKKVGSGTGLGLSISHGIVQRLGGKITIASTPAGRTEPNSDLSIRTTVRVALMVATTQNVNPAPAPPPVEPSRRRARILVIDDEEELLRVVREVLGSAHEVYVASSGRDALELLRADRAFDAILCDLMMPVMTGAEVFTAVAAMDAALAERVIFMTGGALTTGIRDFLGRHDNRILQKPFDRAELLALLSIV